MEEERQVREIEKPTKLWAVVNSEGEVLKARRTREQAEEWMNSEEGKEAMKRRGGTFNVEQIMDLQKP